MSKCPFCQQDAACGINRQQECWCFIESIPQQILDLLPPKAQGIACICQQCIRAYHDNPLAFQRKYTLHLNP